MKRHVKGLLGAVDHRQAVLVLELVDQLGRELFCQLVELPVELLDPGQLQHRKQRRQPLAERQRKRKERRCRSERTCSTMIECARASSIRSSGCSPPS